MLSTEDKDALYDLITAVIGEDASIRAARHRFNEATIGVAEVLLKESARCNAGMYELLTGLVGGASLLAKGWLRRSLKVVSRAMKESDYRLNGYACRVAIKSQWKREVLMTTM